MSVILKFDVQKRKQLRFSEVTTQKRPNFACDNYIYPKQGKQFEFEYLFCGRRCNHQTASWFHAYWSFTSEPTIRKNDESYPNTDLEINCGQPLQLK